jgi:hypothetical protein
MFVIGATRSRSPPMPVPEPFGQGVGRFQRRCRKGKENRDGQATDTDLGLQACRAHPPEAPRRTPKSRRPCRRNALHVARRRTSGHDYGRARCQHESSRHSASRRALTYTTPRRQSVQYMQSRLPEMQECDLVPTSDVRLTTSTRTTKSLKKRRCLCNAAIQYRGSCCRVPHFRRPLSASAPPQPIAPPVPASESGTQPPRRHHGESAPQPRTRRDIGAGRRKCDGRATCSTTVRMDAASRVGGSGEFQRSWLLIRGD